MTELSSAPPSDAVSQPDMESSPAAGAEPAMLQTVRGANTLRAMLGMIVAMERDLDQPGALRRHLRAIAQEADKL